MRRYIADFGARRARPNQDHLRLPFVGNAEQMAEGIERLAAAWEEYGAERRDDRRAMRVVV